MDQIGLLTESQDKSEVGTIGDIDRPRVSVILPAYNEEGFVRRSVESILGQTFTNFELILLDDGSTDNTWNVIETFDDPRICSYRLNRTGFTKTLNHGLSLARGEYVARMDADDESLPQRLERQVEFLDANPDISVLGTSYYKYDRLRGEYFIRSHPESDQRIRRNMAFYIPINHGTVMFRRALVETIGGYDESITTEVDLELWLRAAPHFRFANLGPPPLYIYWFDPQNSFFESSLGRFNRIWGSTRLNFSAIRRLRLPPYYYGLLIARILYYFALPDRLKRAARKLIPGMTETPVNCPIENRGPVVRKATHK